MPSHTLIFFIKKLKQYYSPKVNGLGPREKPKEGVFINSKLESVDIFLGESEPDPDSCRLSCADTEEILRCNVPEFIVDESFGDEFGAEFKEKKIFLKLFSRKKHFLKKKKNPQHARKFKKV